MGCGHVAWVDISKASGVSLVDHDRLQVLGGTLRAPRQQYPQILTFIGQQKTREAINAMFPGIGSLRDRDNHALASLYIDPTSRESEDPIFVADALLGTAPVAAECTPQPCHGMALTPVSWTKEPRRMGEAVLPQLIAPFSHVVVMFADDLSGMPGVRDLLGAWSAYDVATNLPASARPRLLVVVKTPDVAHAADAQLQEEELTSFFRSGRLHSHFSATTLSRIRATPKGWSFLRELLRSELKSAEDGKRRGCARFTALHLSSFFKRATKHIASHVPHTFDFVSTSHCPRPFAHPHPDLFNDFLAATARHKIPFHPVSTLIASAIVLDAYPLGSHAFCPSEIYAGRYESTIRTALEVSYSPYVLPGPDHCRKDFARHLSDQVAAIVLHLAGEIARSHGTSTTLVRRTARQSSLIMQQHLSRDVRCCPICLWNVPAHCFPCGHAICEACVHGFGRAQTDRYYCYIFSECLVCGDARGLTVLLKPPTAGVRILSVDGGGARAVVTLEYLRLLEQIMGPTCHVQDLFDIAVGTSAGGLVVLGLFQRGWTISRCLEEFSQFAQRIFRNRPLSLISRIRAVGRLLLMDNVYSTEALVEALQTSFGASTPMFGPPATGESRCKFAVTAATATGVVPNGRPACFLFTNYNRARIDRDGCPGVNDVLPREDLGPVEPFVWQAAWATAAAPLFFRPAEIDGHAPYQDGAMLANNPTIRAILASRSIWNVQHKTPVDVIVSLGTGRSSRNRGTGSDRATRGAHRGAVFRLMAWALLTAQEKLNPEGTHDALSELLGDDTTYYRVNPEFDNLPSMDDASSMEFLRAAVCSSVDALELSHMACSILASAFFFELSTAPELHVLALLHTVHTGDIDIVTDRPDLPVLARVHGTTDFCTGCRRFNKPIVFRVTHMAHKVTLYLKLGDVQFELSGFPNSIQWHVIQQGLDSPIRGPSDDIEPCPQCRAILRPQLQVSRGE